LEIVDVSNDVTRRERLSGRECAGVSTPCLIVVRGPL
jgi:hypothetical protein